MQSTTAWVTYPTRLVTSALVWCAMTVPGSPESVPDRPKYFPAIQAVASLNTQLIAVRFIDHRPSGDEVRQG